MNNDDIELVPCLVEEGLATHGTDGDDLLLTLARSLSAQDEVNEESLEGLFAGVREVADAAEGALDRWETERPANTGTSVETPAPKPAVASVFESVGLGTGVDEIREGEQMRLL